MYPAVERPHTHTITGTHTNTPGENTDDSGTGSGEFLPVSRRLAFGSRGPGAGRKPRDEVSLTPELWVRKLCLS